MPSANSAFSADIDIFIIPSLLLHHLTYKYSIVKLFSYLRKLKSLGLVLIPTCASIVDSYDYFEMR